VVFAQEGVMVVSSLRWMGQAWVAMVLAALTVWAAEPPSPSASTDTKPTSERTAEPAGKSSPTPTKTPAPRTKDESSTGRPRDLSELPAPAGAILVICREVKDALNLIPEGVFLTPERYRALLDQIDQLERQAKAVKPAVPSACKLTGKVVGDLVQLQAQFDFRTDRPRAQVTLGCQRAWLKPGATLDGQLPLLLNGEDGQVLVQVEKPGVHQVNLELELPLALRGAKNQEQGFDLGLPRAAITTLDQFTLTRSVAEVRVNGRTVRTKPGDGSAARLEGIALGPVDHLDLAWKGPTATPQKGPPLLEARGQIAVRVTEAAVLTDVELSLQVVWGETREWHIRLPPQVVPEVREPHLSDEHIESIELPDEKNRFLKIRLKEPTTEPLKVVFQVRQPRARGPMPVGSFPVQGALKQRGTITVSAPPELRLRFTPRGDVLRRDIGEESPRENAVAEFSYGNLPTSTHPAQPAQAPLEIQVEEVKGVVEARVEHNLLLTEEGWRITTKAFVTPVRTKVNQLELELPAGFQYDRDVGATPADIVDGPVEISEGTGKNRTARIKLFKEQTQPFTVSLSGMSALAPGVQSQTLELPRVLHFQDRGGPVTVSLSEGMELLPTGSMPDAPVPGERQRTWRFDRFPTRIDLAWQPHRPDLPAGNIVDVTVVGTTVRVRQRLSLPIGPTVPKKATLVIPESLTGRLRITAGGTLEPNGTVKLTPATGKEQVLECAYAFNLDGAQEPRSERAGTLPGRRYRLPLVRLAEATHVDSRLRVWTDPGTWPALAAGPWEEQPTEVVADRDSLPALVLHSGSLNYPLTLELKEQTALPVAPVVIDHALIQVVVVEGGSQSYRARFLVSRLNARHLDIEFPAPLALLTPELLLDGKKITRLKALPAGSQGNESGSLLRLPIDPELFHKPTVLEVRYRMTPALAKGASRWATTLAPPVPQGEVLLGRVRWQVALPPGWVPIYQGGGQLAEQRWLWLRGLLVPRPAAGTADLERWLMAGSAVAGNGRESSTNGDDLAASLESWQTALRPVDLYHAPNQLWLFACSALLLGVGLGLTYAPLSRRQLGVILVGVGVAIGFTAVWCPGVLSALLYGSEPGMVVLLLILAVQWMLQRRYRRQVVFMPGFTRLKTGSSLVRRESKNQPRGEPSTVDAPTKKESSAKQKVEGT
jgi:hypothetical protein